MEVVEQQLSGFWINFKKKTHTDQDTMKHNRQTNKQANKTHTKTATTEKNLNKF